MKTTITTLATLFTLTVGQQAAGAGEILLDQEVDIPEFIGTRTTGQVEKGYTRAQTFTVGIAGQLSRIDLEIAYITTIPPTRGLNLEVRTTTGGVPTNTVLATVLLPAASVPPSPTELHDPYPFASFDVSSAGLVVSPGEQLAIVLTTESESPSFYGWHANDINQDPGQLVAYDGGVQFFFLGENPDPGDWNKLDDEFSDLGFRTYVAIIPEPSTLALATCALLGLVGRRKRR